LKSPINWTYWRWLYWSHWYKYW